MAERGGFSAKSGAEIAAAKEALSAQQQLLHKLYAELDKEREASETAASETLSMIMRLQLEKAAVEMETSQYKRMAEEKLFHANECLQLFEDVIYHKDLQIASLECQIQAYKYKILSLGCYDRSCGETENLKSTFLQKIEFMFEEGDTRYPIEENEKVRANSIAWTENESVLEESKSVAFDQELRAESGETQDTGSSYWQQIKNLDERVKELKECALCSYRSINVVNSCIEPVQKQPEVLHETNAVVDSVCSTSVQDIFEVPEVSMSHINIVETEEDIAGCKIRLLETDSSRRKVLDHYNIPSVSSAMSNAESRSEVRKLSKIIERLEHAANGINSRQEISVVRNEELVSMKEMINKIQTQLSAVQTDIKSLNTLKSKKHDDSVFCIFREEMLHFWL